MKLRPRTCRPLSRSSSSAVSVALPNPHTQVNDVLVLARKYTTTGADARAYPGLIDYARFRRAFDANQGAGGAVTAATDHSADTQVGRGSS